MSLKLSIGIVFIMTTMLGCKHEPVYKKEGWTAEMFKPEVIQLSKATLNGKPIIKSKSQLLLDEGDPFEIRDSCSSFALIPRQGNVYYDCWIYDSTWNKVYHVVGDSSYLYRYNFIDTQPPIETPNLQLSTSTSLGQIRSLFKNSFSHRNIGANMGRIDGYEWIYLIDDLPTASKAYPNRVELRFKKGKLFQMEYSWNPTYTDEQLKVYNRHRLKFDKEQKQ